MDKFISKGFILKKYGLILLHLLCTAVSWFHKFCKQMKKYTLLMSIRDHPLTHASTWKNFIWPWHMGKTNTGYAKVPYSIKELKLKVAYCIHAQKCIHITENTGLQVRLLEHSWAFRLSFWMPPTTISRSWHHIPFSCIIYSNVIIQTKAR